MNVHGMRRYSALLGHKWAVGLMNFMHVGPTATAGLNGDLCSRHLLLFQADSDMAVRPAFVAGTIAPRISNISGNNVLQSGPGFAGWVATS